MLFLTYSLDSWVKLICFGSSLSWTCRFDLIDHHSFWDQPHHFLKTVSVHTYFPFYNFWGLKFNLKVTLVKKKKSHSLSFKSSSSGLRYSKLDIYGSWGHGEPFWSISFESYMVPSRIILTSVLSIWILLHVYFS